MTEKKSVHQVQDQNGIRIQAQAVETSFRVLASAQALVQLQGKV